MPSETIADSHQLGSCHTTGFPGPIPCARRKPPSRSAASTSSAQVSSCVPWISAVDDPNSVAFRRIMAPSWMSVCRPIARYPACNSYGNGAGAKSIIPLMWRTLPRRDETATMDVPEATVVIGVQDLFARYAHRIDRRDFAGFGELFTEDGQFFLGDDGARGRDAIRDFMVGIMKSPG